MKTLKYLISMFFILMSNAYGWSQNTVINQIAVLDSSTYSITMGRQALICDNTGDFHLFYVLRTDTVDYVIHRSSDYLGRAWSTPDTISVFSHTGMPSRFVAQSPTATVDEQNKLHVLYEYRGSPVYYGSNSYPPSHMNYVTNQSGDWITQTNVINDSLVQNSQGMSSTVSYLSSNQVITYQNHQHYIGYDYAWFATKYNVVYSNNISGTWGKGDTLHTYNLGDYDNIILNAPSMVVNNDSLFALWYQRYDCQVEMKSFDGTDWSPMQVLYNDVVYPAPHPTSYVVRVESSFNNEEARVAMFRTPPSSDFNELLLMCKSKNHNWTVDTMMVPYSYYIVRPVLIQDTTYIFLVYPSVDSVPSTLVKYTEDHSFISDSPLETNTGEQKFYNLVTTGTSVNPIAYLVFDTDKNRYYLKIGEISDITTGVTTERFNVENGVKLWQNSPNPVASKTKISYSIEKGGVVKLEVFDIRGRSLGTLVHDYQAPGNYSVDFDARDLRQGIYFYKITAQGSTLTRKMMVVK